MANMDFKNTKNTTKMLNNTLETPRRPKDQNKLHQQWNFKLKVSKTCPDYHNTLKQYLNFEVRTCLEDHCRLQQ